MHRPRVSVGIPVCNGETYLRAAIESILAQDYSDFELILSDNCSTDSTGEICRHYTALDSRVKYFRNEVNIGAVPNFNRVFSLAQGEFFKWLAYDDVCYPGLLGRCVDVLDRAPSEVALVYPAGELIDDTNSSIGTIIENVETRAKHPYERLRRVLVKRSNALALCGLIRSSHLRQTQLRRSYVLDDMGLLTELALIGEFIQLPDTLLKIRVHARNARTLHATTRSHAVWLDPANTASRIILNPQVRLFVECFRSVLYVALGKREKLLCWLTIVMAYCERPLRTLAGRWKRRLHDMRALAEGTRPKAGQKS